MVITENRWNTLEPGKSLEADVYAVLGEPDQKVPDVRYGSLHGFSLLGYAGQAASLFVREGRLLLIAIAPNAKNGLDAGSATWSAALAEQKPERVLDSRIDKNAMLYLYAEQGLALHMASGRVELVEVFPSMSVDAYLKHLYVPPPVFRK